MAHTAGTYFSLHGEGILLPLKWILVDRRQPIPLSFLRYVGFAHQFRGYWKPLSALRFKALLNLTKGQAA